MITEEQKQEADSIVDFYLQYCHYSTDREFVSREKAIETRRKYATHCAIQDRQSVLEDNKSVFEMLKIHGDLRTRLPIEDRIQSLTNQIIYLKSKI